MNIITEQEQEMTIGRIVALDFRTAEVFKKYGIDFCCKGNRMLPDVCREKKLDFNTIEQELNEKIMRVAAKSDVDFKLMPLNELAAYIESVHHAYVRESIPLLLGYLNKINKVHGERHPELNELYQEFEGCANELTQHMVKEETILFPAIKKLAEASKSGTNTLSPFFFGALENPISMMQHEHTVEGDRFVRIAELTNNFIAPADACTTYKVAFQKLEEFQNDLFTHIHLENNILFPGSVELEQKVHFKL